MTHMPMPRNLVIAQYIWLIGAALAMVGALIGAVIVPEGLMWVVVAATAVQAAITIPMALLLRRGKNYARITLLVFAALSIGSLYQAFQQEAWPSLVLNLALGCTLGLLASPEAKQYCRRVNPHEQA